jgi:hypothetical protein
LKPWPSCATFDCTVDSDTVVCAFECELHAHTRMHTQRKRERGTSSSRRDVLELATKGDGLGVLVLDQIDQIVQQRGIALG